MLVRRPMDFRDADAAEFIMASGKPASQGGTYERTVLRRFEIRAKPLADRAVPHMSQMDIWPAPRP